MLVDGNYIDSMPVNQAMAKMREVLAKAKGPKLYITVGDVERMLYHNAASHASATKLPWPFSKLEMRDYGLLFAKSDGSGVDFTRPERRFSKNQLDQAIMEFLTGSTPETEVRFYVEL